MALQPAEISVGTTATLLGGASADDRGQASDASRAGISIVVANIGAAVVFLGPATVTASGAGKGFTLAAGAQIALDLDPTEAMYGIVASGTNTVSVLRTSA